MCDLESVKIDNGVYAILMKDGRTALWHAAMERNEPVVQLFLDMGADVCIQNGVCVSKYWWSIWASTNATSADFVMLFVNITCIFMEIGVLAYIET